MKMNRFKFLCIVSLLVASSGFAAELTKSDIRNIILSGTNLSHRRAKTIADQLEKTHGTSEGGKLNISGLLVGSRLNYIEPFIITDRKVWKFDASFIPEGSQQVITVPGLVEAEFHNSGIKVNLISQDWAIVALPKNLKIEQLDGLTTSRGFSINILGFTYLAVNAIAPSVGLAAVLALPMWTFTVAPGTVNTSHGWISFMTTSFGLKYNFFTLPWMKFKVNRDLKPMNPFVDENLSSEISVKENTLVP